MPGSHSWGSLRLSVYSVRSVAEPKPLTPGRFRTPGSFVMIYSLLQEPFLEGQELALKLKLIAYYL